jgi:hypothetical protein
MPRDRDLIEMPVSPTIGGPTGYAFATFSTTVGAEQAISSLHGTMLAGRQLSFVPIGRVSPQPGPSPYPAAGLRAVPAFETTKPAATQPHRDHGVTTIDDSPPSFEKARLAIRYGAYDAALDAEGLHWSRVNLLSTGGGHQVKEEEL